MRSMMFEHAEAWQDEYCWTVAFGKARDGSGDYVTLQLAKEPDDQDRALGLDEIYLEINDQSHGGYGAVRAIQLGNDLVRVTFDPDRLGLTAYGSPLEIHSVDADHLFADVKKVLSLMGESSKATVTEI